MRAVPIGPGDRQRDAVAALRAPPGALDAVGNARRPTGGSDPHAASVLPFGHDQPAGDVAAFQIAQVQLQPVRVNLVGLVVEPQRRRVGGAETQVRLRHLYGEVERLVVPAGIGDRGEIFGPGVRLFAATILVLELESQRLAGIEPVAAAVERGTPLHPQRRPLRRLGGIELHERCERRLPAASSTTQGPSRSATKRTTRETNWSVSSASSHRPRVVTSPRPAKCQGNSKRCSSRLASSTMSSTYAGPDTMVRVTSP